MRCPFCMATETKVVDSREVVNTFDVRRRRECEKCHKRFTTYERIEQNPIAIIKKDGRREVFSPQKLKTAIALACHKRPVSAELIDGFCAEIEASLRNEAESEIASSFIGELVMEKLKTADKVAYIRFASIYRDFADVKDFRKAIKEVSESASRTASSKPKPAMASEDMEQQDTNAAEHGGGPETCGKKDTL